MLTSMVSFITWCRVSSVNEVLMTMSQTIIKPDNLYGTTFDLIVQL